MDKPTVEEVIAWHDACADAWARDAAQVHGSELEDIFRESFAEHRRFVEAITILKAKADAVEADLADREATIDDIHKLMKDAEIRAGLLADAVDVLEAAVREALTCLTLLKVPAGSKVCSQLSKALETLNTIREVKS